MQVYLQIQPTTLLATKAVLTVASLRQTPASMETQTREDSMRTFPSMECSQTNQTNR